MRSEPKKLKNKTQDNMDVRLTYKLDAFYKSFRLLEYVDVRFFVHFQEKKFNLSYEHFFLTCLRTTAPWLFPRYKLSRLAAIFTFTHSYFGHSPAGIRGSQVRSRVRPRAGPRANMKVAVQSRRAKIKRVFLTLDSSVLVAYGGHSVWSNDNHVLLRGRDLGALLAIG